MGGAESGRGREDYDVDARRQYFLVRVESCEHAVFGDLASVLKLLFEVADAAFCAIGENVSDRPDDNSGFCGGGIIGSTGSSAASADQSDLDLGGGIGENSGGNGRGYGCGGSRFEEISTRRTVKVLHGFSILSGIGKIGTKIFGIGTEI